MPNFGKIWQNGKKEKKQKTKYNVDSLRLRIYIVRESERNAKNHKKNTQEKMRDKCTREKRNRNATICMILGFYKKSQKNPKLISTKL